MRLFTISILIFCKSFLGGQTSSDHLLKVHFLYGSKPLHKYRKTEKKLFGGLHGGHVSFEIDSVDYGFGPEGKFHLIAHKNNCHSLFRQKPTYGKPVYPDGEKVTTFIIPVTEEQYNKLKLLTAGYCCETPYDYAFIGMRCASSAQDVFAQAGLVKHRNRFSNIITTFYPKMLRKRFFRMAKQNHYTIIKKEGRKTRKWEKD
jgi:hypothetical protein